MNTFTGHLANLSVEDLTRREEQLKSHFDLLTSSGLTTSDGRDKIESCEAAIIASTTEEERAYHRADLKKSWPRAEILGCKDVPFWDKRDLVNLYENISFKGNVGTETLIVTPEFLHLQQLPIHHTTVSRSTLKHSTHSNKVVKSENESVVEKVLYWHTPIKNVTTTEKRELNWEKRFS